MMLRTSKAKFLIALARNEMTSTELKEKSGVGRNTIQRLMSHDSEITPKLLGKLAKALNCDVTELIGE